MTKLEVNGTPVSAEAIRDQAAILRNQAMAEGRQLTPEDAVECLIQAERLLVERVVLEQEVERLGIIASDEEVTEALAALLPRADGTSACRAGMDSHASRGEIERRVKIDKLVDIWAYAEPVAGKKKMAREAYVRYRDRLDRPEARFLLQIVKNVHHEDEREQARASIEAAARELSAGKPFGEMAERYSDCPENGGALGYVARGEMAPEFDAMAFAMPLRQTSPIFETRFGFHIVHVSEIRPAGIVPFAEALPFLEQALEREIRGQQCARRLEELVARATVRRLKN